MKRFALCILTIVASLIIILAGCDAISLMVILVLSTFYGYSVLSMNFALLLAFFAVAALLGGVIIAICRKLE